ncbi:membrane protein insertase YidC [Paenimyroides tangerinum]|uniref:Membrane protein insertase YidC n=1 Tax=Paenimyroides tangerinum TaxID=2488728 RepID=A0A3P3W8N1_9FLAO|nr:membrane protein insertase YidC [Paenimyroides tangerinum]RRJ91505.1 membrane protein insertase YidC [Paenimyroides tangerinum]
MEEKKLDKSSLIGMGLLAGLLFWMVSGNFGKEDEKLEDEKQKTEKVDTTEMAVAEIFNAPPTDSLATEKFKAALGDFAYSATLPAAYDEEVVVATDFLTVTFSNKGGYIKTLELNGIHAISKNSKEIVTLIKDNNSKLNLKFQTKDNRVFNTKDLVFEPTVSKEGENTVVSMRLKSSANAFLEYRYVIKPNNYMLDFTIKTVGLTNVINGSNPADLDWQLKAYRNEKSISYENRYTEMVYEYDGDKDDYLSASSAVDDATEKDVNFIAFKQHFFTSILLTDTTFKSAVLKSENLVKDEAVDTTFTKNFQASVPLEFKGGELNYNMNLYFGPASYDILKSYEGKNLTKVMPLGWGIFGWINEFIFIPVFGILASFLPYGIAIIALTILVRIVMSPITYKSYVSQAKMKLIRPEVNEINEKYKNDPMKKQQETMKLYSAAGVNPMAGCLPALAQIPVFYALFQFFPSAFDLRQKSFLWADDLSSYDNVIQLPFTIPFYGDHVSLFPILASVAIFFYMKMTTGDQPQMAPQEGMPDMSKIMKIMIYISPLMMLFFFNNYASGLSLYYFVSNMITILIMWVIKNKIVNDDKLKLKMEENKTKEKPQGKFQRKMQQMMEQAQAAQEQQKKNKK